MIHIHQREASEFDESTFKTIDLKAGVKAVIGRPKGSGKTATVKLAFDPNRYDEDSARSWARRHGFRASDTEALLSLSEREGNGVRRFIEVFPDQFDGKFVRLQAFKAGHFVHDEYGEFDITDAMLQEIARNFTDTKRALVLDFDHGTDFGKTMEDKLALGWHRAVDYIPFGESGGPEVWVTLEVNDKTYGHVNNGEILYYSPTWSEKFFNKETGKNQGATLKRGALTNTPFLDGMHPAIPLSENTRRVLERSLREEEQMLVNLKKWGGPEEADAGAAVKFLGERLDKAIEEKSGLEAAATKGADHASKVVSLSEKLAETEKRLGEVEQARKREAKDRFFAEHSNRVGKAERESLDALYDIDEAKCLSIVRALPVKYPSTPTAIGGGSGTPTPGAVARFMAEVDKVVKEDNKSFTEASRIVAARNPHLKREYDAELQDGAAQYQRTGRHNPMDGEVV